MTEYVRRNFARIIGLESPEPLASMYNRDYFRATWVTTALDAGFWTAMRLKPKWFRDTCSMVFTLYYLVCAERADEVVRKVRGKLSLEHMRVSWNKGTTPYLAFIGRMRRPKHLRIQYRPRSIRIPRPKGSPYTEPIRAWLYFDGPLLELKNQDKIIMDIPGGGFVAMDPRCHDDKLIAWAAKTGFPVVALDYKKAPEYPYPYALNECYDAYFMIHASKGRIVGLPGDTVPKVVLSGDSAGGNLAVGTVLKILQSRTDPSRHRHVELPLPEALVLIYPALDVNITSWLTDEQSALIRHPARSQGNKGVARRKTEDYHTLINTPVPSEEDLDEGLRMTQLKRNKTSTVFKDTPMNGSLEKHGRDETEPIPHPDEVAAFTHVEETDVITKARRLRTRLEMSSMISYFNDRILSPEVLRGMIIMYIGEQDRPDFATDFLLSPLRAPEELLREFPKVYMLTGERDPLCDDTAIFEGRLRSAHEHKFQTRKDLGLIPERVEFDEKKHVEVEFIPGVSHGFLQFASVYKPAWGYIEKCSRWMKRAFAEAAERDERGTTLNSDRDYFSIRKSYGTGMRRSRRNSEGESSDYEDRPLEMSSISFNPGSQAKSKTGGSPGSSSARRQISGRGGIKKPFDGRVSPVLTRNNRSLQKLASMEHLIERRMEGVAIGLMGDDDGDPKTPA